MRILALSLVLAAGALLGTPNSARCAWCLGNPCYSRGQCGQGCVCLRASMTEPGTCVSLQAKP